MNRRDPWILGGFVLAYIVIFVVNRPVTYGSTDEAGYYGMAQVLRRGTVFADVANYPLYAAEPSQGHLVSKWPAGQPALLALFTLGGNHGPFYANFCVHLLTWCLFGMALRQVGLDVRWSLLYLLFPPFLLYNRTLLSDFGALLGTSVSLVGLARREETPVSWRWIGFGLGMSTLFRSPMMVVAGAVGLWAVALDFLEWRRRGQGMFGRWFHFGLGLFPALLFTLVYNTLVYGGPLKQAAGNAPTYYFHARAFPYLFLFYLLAVTLLYPGMSVGLVATRVPGRGVIVASVGSLVLLHSFYDYITQGRNIAETLVAGFRYLLPVMPFSLFAYIGWLDDLARRYRIKVEPVVLPVAVLLLGFAVGLSRAHAAYLQRQVDLRETLLQNTPPDAVLLCNKDIAKLFQPVWGYREYALLTDAAGHYRPPKLERYQGRPVFIAVLLRPERPSEKDDAAEAVRRVLALPGVKAEPIKTPFHNLSFNRVLILN